MLERLYIKTLLNDLSIKDRRTLYKWCANHGVAILSDPGSNKLYVLKAEYESAKSKTANQCLQNRYGAENTAHLNANMKFYADYRKATQYKPSAIHTPTFDNFRSKSMMMPAMPDKMQPLALPIGVKQIQIYCYTCGVNVTSICKQINQPFENCPNIGTTQHKYKVYVHVKGTRNTRKTKVLETRDLNEAIRHAQEFARSVNGEQAMPETQTEPQQVVYAPIQNNHQDLSLLYTEAKERFLNYKKNINTPTHLQRETSTAHIAEYERVFKRFESSIMEVDPDCRMESYNLKQINDATVGVFYDSLKALGFEGRTIDKSISLMSAFINYLKTEEELPLKNYFRKVKKHKKVPVTLTITGNELTALLDRISEKNGVAIFPGSVKSVRNYYTPYLSSGIRLLAFSGRRREEGTSMKWNQVIYNENNFPVCIAVNDIKVNRIQNRKEDESKKKVFVPVTAELFALLQELGYEEFRDSDQYILAPEVTGKNRHKIICENLSRGFSFFYQQLGTGRPLTLKCLRKTYISNLSTYMHDVKTVSGHSGNKILESYINPITTAKSVQGFSVFGQEEKMNRELKLQQLRSKDISDEQNEIER